MAIQAWVRVNQLYSGIHAPNMGIQQADLDLVREMGAGAASAKLMRIESCMHTSVDVGRLRQHGVRNFVVRGPDSRMLNGRYPSPEEYAAYFVGVVNEFYSVGVRLFQVDNEPNSTGAWDSLEYGPWQHQFFFRNALPLIRRSIPQDVKLLAPPLSFAPNLWRPNPYNAWVLDDWFAAYQWTDAGCKPIFWQLFDYVGCNVYFGNPNKLRDPSYGMSYRQIHQRSQGMPIVVTEYGCSAHLIFNPDGTRRYTDAEVDTIRCETYPAWLEDAHDEGYVQSAHAFILGGSEDWAGYKISPTVGQAMRAWAHTHEQVNL